MQICLSLYPACLWSLVLLYCTWSALGQPCESLCGLEVARQETPHWGHWADHRTVYIQFGEGPKPLAADDPVTQFRCQGSPSCSVARSQVHRSPEWPLHQVFHMWTIYPLEHDLRSWNFLERWTVTGCLSFLSLSLECCWRLLWCVLPEAVQWFSPQLSGCWAETVMREALLSDDFPRGGAVSVGHTCASRRLGILYQPWQSLFEHHTIRALFSW